MWKKLIYRYQVPQYVLLVSWCAFFGLFLRHVEFIFNEDYSRIRTLLTYGSLNIIPDDFSIAGLQYYFQQILQNLFLSPHGPSPFFILGPIYRILDLLGVDFNLNLLHLPTLVFGLVTVCLFYYILVRNGYGIFVSILGSMLLVIMPSFCLNLRSIGFFYMLEIAFNQALGVWAFQQLGRNKHSKWILGLVLTHFVLSDNLLLLNVPALLVAWLLKDYVLGSNTVKSIKQQVLHNVELLRPKIVWLPALAALLLTLVMSIIGAWGELGSYSTTFLRVGNHLTDNGSALRGEHFIRPILSIGKIFYTTTFLYGELAIPILLACVVGIVFFFRSKLARTDFLINYAIIAGAGYCVLWLFLYPAFTGYTFFISTCVPLTLLLVIVLHHLYNKSKILTAIVFACIFISTFAANFELVWRGNGLLAKIPHIHDKHYGTIRRNDGSKSLGFLIREIIDYELRNHSHDQIRIIGYNYGFGKLRSVRAFAGLTRNEETIQENYGVAARIVVLDDTVSNKYFPAGDWGVHKVLLDFRPHKGKNYSDSTPLYENYSALRIVSQQGKTLSSLFVTPEIKDSQCPYHSGAFLIDSLDHKFSMQYNRLYDFFPIRVYGN